MKRIFMITTATLAAMAVVFAMPPRPGLHIIDPTANSQLVEKPNLEGLINITTKDGHRIMMSALAKGTKRYPVLLIEYTDQVHPADHTVAKFDSSLFVPHGIGSGSLNDYYKEVSYQSLDVQGQCYGWYQSGNTVKYYGNYYNSTNPDSVYGVCPYIPGTTTPSYPHNVAGLVVKALKTADAAGVDFTQFSNIGGKLELLIVIHAGAGAEGNPGNFDLIWSHNSDLAMWPGVSLADRTVDGLQVTNYTIQPGLSSIVSGGMIEIGVVAHELGHALGLPDLYDTYDPSSNGLGCWSLMAAGSWGGDYDHPQYPSHPDAWCKKFLGWATTRNVGVNSRDSLAQVESNPHLLTLWKNGSPGSQYFLVENRRKTGFDTLLFDAGLLVYHIDENVINAYLATNGVNQKRHGLYGVALEEASHATHLWSGTNNGDASDAFASGNSFATPYSNDNSNQITNVQIGNISVSGPVMWADYVVGSDFNISLLQNPAFSYNLGISMVSSYSLQTPDNLDTANLIIGASPPVRLNFSHPSASTFQASYTLQQAGNYKIRVVSKDVNDTNRAGERIFTVIAAKAAGGIVAALNGAIRLAFPRGAVAHDELWVVCADNDRANPGAEAAGPAFQVGPSGRLLAAPAELILRYDPAVLNGRDPARLGICEMANGQWRYLGGRLDAAERSVSAPVSAGGVYQLCWSETFPVMPSAAAAMPVTANPSPFARTVMISYQLGAPSRVSLKIYNIAGQLVRTILDAHQGAGAHAAVWDGRSECNGQLPSGIYHYRLQIGDQTKAGRMVKVQ